MPESIGNQVNVPGTRGKGILRYQGSIHGKSGIFAGIELLGPIALTRGKNSGDVEGFKYFEVQQPLSGLFLPFERLKAVNPDIDFTRDMISEVNLAFNNDALDAEVPVVSPVAVVSPTPQTRPYSADILKTRYNNLSPILTVGKRQTLGERSRTSSLSSFSRSPVLNSINYRSTSYNEGVTKRLSNSSVSHVEQELYDLRCKYEKSEREMNEKLSILKELRDTVQELQPILKQYENDLDDRDRKILKIRNEFELAREDWRQNLDIMVNTYEANESYYESKIRELQKAVSAKNNDDELKAVERKLEQVNEEKNEIENSYKAQIAELELKFSSDQSKDLNKKILEQQKEIESLSTQLVEIRKFPNENLNDFDQKILKLEAEIENLHHYKSRCETLENENVELQKELERRHSFEKLEDRNSELTKLHDTITDLKDQLSTKDKEILELEDSLDNKVKQIDTGDDAKMKELQEDMFFKDQEIQALQQQLDKTNQTVATQKQKLKQLQTTDDKDQTIESLELEKLEKDKVIKQLEEKLEASIVKEIDTLNINDTAAMNEVTYKEEIEKLRHELDTRPTFEELTELQDNIDEMVRLHNNEVFFKLEEVQRLQKENEKLQTRLERALEGNVGKFSDKRLSEGRFSDNASKFSEGSKFTDNASKISDGSKISDYSHDAISINSVPIYKPEIEIDPSAGRDNWCGLCEREGHSSLNCPYENDIF